MASAGVLAAAGPAAAQDEQEQTGHDGGAAPDTVRYVEVVEGRTIGSWRTWLEGPRTRGEAPVDGPAFYQLAHPAIDLGVLVRALLRRPSRELALLPEGRARLEALGEQVAEAGGQRRAVRLFAVHGTALYPRYVWLDGQGATFADEWSVREGWQAAFPALRATVDSAVAGDLRELAATVTPAPRSGPLVIRGARLFDPRTGDVRQGTTIVVEGGRVAAVGPDGTVDVPADAKVLEAEGRFAMPGLWDVHAHLRNPAQQSQIFVRGAEALHLAAGVTSVRDRGSHVGSLVALREAIRAGDAVGPRIEVAGFLYDTAQTDVGAGEDRRSWHQVFAGLSPDAEPVREFVSLLAERGVAVDPTMGVFASESAPPEFMADEVDRLPPPVARYYRHKPYYPGYFPRSPLARDAREEGLANLLSLLPALHEAGVPILPGTDTWPGFGLHYELELYAEAGIPAPEVLTLATLGAARAMGRADDLGTVEPGKLADLILVDGDPTEDIGDLRRVTTVVKGGTVYDPAAIHRALGIEPCCEESGSPGAPTSSSTRRAWTAWSPRSGSSRPGRPPGSRPWTF